jgi:outer membrane usher protein
MRYNNIIRGLIISGMIPFCFSASNLAYAQDHFNPNLLNTSDAAPSEVDLSHYENGIQAPGKYRVDVYINQKMVDTQEITFNLNNEAKGDQALQPCLSVEQLSAWGVKTENYPELSVQGNQCANLSVIPEVTSVLKFSDQRLDLSIPQIAMHAVARDYVAPDQWDEGINAAMMNYSFTGTTTKPRAAGESAGNSQYMNLRPGFNLGAWRFRNYSTWNHDDTGVNEWDSVNNYVTRDIKTLKSQLTLGDSNSPSDIFDSIAFTGAQMASDDDMIPDSQKGYAPVIHGIARTNAEVTVSQNGHSIYKTSVAPGAFEINDLYPTGGSGDMDVLVKESDGTEQHLVVPYAALPVLQREGRFKYSTTVGHTRDASSEDVGFGQMTASYGFSHGITAYGGIQATQKGYEAVAMGAGLNLGDFGAISADVTQSWAVVNNAGQTAGVDDSTNQTNLKKESGESWRVRYSKNIVATGTNFTVAGYRYSTSGYYSLQDALNTFDESDDYNYGRSRNRTELSMSQNIVYGSLSVNLVNENYWDKSRTTSLNLGYNNSIGGISYGLNYSYNINADNNTADDNRSDDQQITFNVSIPLEKFLPSSYATFNMSGSKNSPATYNTGISGSALEDNSLNWQVQEGYSDSDHKTNGSVNSDMRTRYSEFNAGYSYDTNAERFNYGIQGGMLLHRGGLTLSQPFNDTIVLVKAKGAEGVPVNNNAGIKTDGLGYAVVPYASPYKKNAISLDTEQIENNDIELQDTSKNVIPTRGAVVVAEYNTNIGYRVLFNLTSAQGKPLPFGATATDKGTSADDENVHSGIVGDSGSVYIAGLEKSGDLLVKWGADANEQCTAHYQLPEQKSASGVEVLHEQCS